MNRHPEVRAKLNHLYSSGLQPTISGHAQLAQALGIARQNINRWISATSQQPVMPTRRRSRSRWRALVLIRWSATTNQRLPTFMKRLGLLAPLSVRREWPAKVLSFASRRHGSRD